MVDRIPYYVFAVLMFATTFFQQRQMQNASPPGASSQQQAVLKVMPILFGVFGIFFPAGLVLYWTTSNAWQIGQQYFMLKSRPTAEQMAENAKSKPQKAEKKGFMASMMERAEQQRQQRGSATPKPGGKKPGNPKPPASKGGPAAPTPVRSHSRGRIRSSQGPEATAVEEIRRSAPSVEEAVEAALGELGLTEQEADVDVVQEPRPGVFGVGAQDAIVVVRSRVETRRGTSARKISTSRPRSPPSSWRACSNGWASRRRSNRRSRTGRCTWT